MNKRRSIDDAFVGKTKVVKEIPIEPNESEKENEIEDENEISDHDSGRGEDKSV